MTSTPANWYPDPQNPAFVRWWDGRQWTGEVQPIQAAAAPVHGPAPVDRALTRLNVLKGRARKALGSVAVGAAAVIVAIAVAGPEPNTLWYEAGKAAIAVLAVSIVGGFIGYAFFVQQQSLLTEISVQRDADRQAQEMREQARAEQREAEREREQQREQQLEQQREQWRRQVADLRDERDRQDATLRGVFDQTLAAYNAVKRERRLIRSAGTTEISQDRYARFGQRIIDLQLEFESLRRTAPLLTDRRIAPAGAEWSVANPDRFFGSLPEAFATIERYLQALVTEFERALPLTSPSPGAAVELRGLAQLRGFRDARDKSNFEVMSGAAVSVLGVLIGALQMPLELPPPITE